MRCRDAARSYFDPRSPAGSDPESPTSSPNTNYFDPRSPAGSDHSPRRRTKHEAYFDPRSPAGSDSENGRLHSKKGTNHPHAAT